MSLFGALASGVSGLTAQSSAMSAISDNISNVNTVGYKSNKTQFSTLVTKQTSSTRYSSGGVQAKPRQGIDLQGLLESTTNTTDIGISGNGFFVVSEAANPTQDDLWCYTRAGSFQKDNNGYLKNTAGYYLQAWTLLPYDGTEGVSIVEVNGNYYMKAYTDMNGETQYINDNIIDYNNLKPINLETIGGSATATMNVSLGANLPSGDKIYDFRNPEAGGQHSTAALIYDSLGNSHNLGFEFTKTASNAWGLDIKMPAGAATLVTYANTETTQDADPDVYAARAQLEFTRVPDNHSMISMTANGTTYVFEFTTDGMTTYSPQKNEKVIPVDVSTGILTTSDFVERFTGVLQTVMPSGDRFTFTNSTIEIEQSYAGTQIDFDVSKCTSCVQSAANPDPTTGVSTGKFSLVEIDWDVKNVARMQFTGTQATDYLGKSVALGNNIYSFSKTEVPTKNGIVNVNISTAINKDGSVNVTKMLNLLKTCIDKNETESSRFVASGTTLEIHPTASGNDMLVTSADTTSLTFYSKRLNSYVGSTVELGGVTYEFTNGGTPAAGHIGVDLSALAESDGAAEVPALVMNALNNTMRAYYENTPGIEDWSMYFRVSNATMVSTQAYMAVGADTEYTVDSLSFNSNTAADYNGKTVTIAGVTYKLSVTTPAADPAHDVDLTIYTNGEAIAARLAELASANGAPVSANAGVLTGEGATQIITATTMGAEGTLVHNTSTCMDFEGRTGLGNTLANVVGKPYGQQTAEPNDSGTLVLSTTFEYNGVEDAQAGAVVPAVQFNADGTPKYIHISQAAIEWANGAQDMVDGVEGRRIKINLGSANTSTGLTHLSGTFTTNYVSQDGAKFGSYSGVTISEDGIVTAIFDNGETTPIAQIPLATFTDANSMSALTGNVWIETTGSGQPTLRTATQAGAGEITESSLEKSTVDIAEEFTDMIVVQRAYSAAARIITTADTMLEELLTIKR